MTPEQYLTKLISDSPFAWFAVSPESELRKAINILTKSVFSHWENIPIEDLPDLFSPQAGPDPMLMQIRDTLIPFFPEECRDRLASAPVGTLYNLEINGFAAIVPGSNDAVVCLDNGLQSTLYMTNQLLHLFSPDEIRRKKKETNVYAYAATKFMHWIFCLTGKAMPPSYAKPQRDPKTVFTQAMESTLVQMYFVVAHEYSHICLGHIDQKRPAEYNKITRLHELQADEAAANVILAKERLREPPLSHADLELHLGAIGGIFYASDAILNILHLGQPFTRVYPSPEDRFDRVIETFRSHYGNGLMGADQYVQPFGLVSRVFQLIQVNPPEAVAFLSEIARVCRDIGDIIEECFVLAVAREVARLAGGDHVVSEIHSYLEKALAKEPIYGKAILDFRF